MNDENTFLTQVKWVTEVWYVLILKCDTQNKTFKVTWTVLFSPFMPLSMHAFLLKLAIYLHLSWPLSPLCTYWTGPSLPPPCIRTIWTAPNSVFVNESNIK